MCFVGLKEVEMLLLMRQQSTHYVIRVLYVCLRTIFQPVLALLIRKMSNLVSFVSLIQLQFIKKKKKNHRLDRIIEVFDKNNTI